MINNLTHPPEEPQKVYVVVVTHPSKPPRCRVFRKESRAKELVEVVNSIGRGAKASYTLEGVE